MSKNAVKMKIGSSESMQNSGSGGSILGSIFFGFLKYTLSAFTGKKSKGVGILDISISFAKVECCRKTHF